MAGKPGKMTTKAEGHLTLVKADLLSGDEAWDQVFSGQGFNYVMHTASPYFGRVPDDENEYIRPALEGTESVIRACVKHGVRRCVLTSSVAAVFAPLVDGKTYTASDWTDVANPGTSAYQKSKTLAEQAAWKLVEGTSLELCTICPMFVTGPTLYQEKSMLEGFESGELAIKIMKGKFPMVPQITNAISDVRDVALAHLLALDVPAAAGKRFITAHQCRPFVDIIGMFATERPALKIPVRSMPNFLLYVLALCSPELKRAKLFAKNFKVDEETTRTALGIKWTPEAKTVADMMDDFINLGAVPAEKPSSDSAKLVS
jgi:dihydroflavonol-4-reductase